MGKITIQSNLKAKDGYKEHKMFPKFVSLSVNYINESGYGYTEQIWMIP